MASADTLCKKLLNVKHTVVESHDFYTGADGVAHLRIKARPNAWHQDDCPFCGRRCPGYDHPAKHRKIWRGLDFGGILVEIEGDTHRIRCPEHGVVTAARGWCFLKKHITTIFFWGGKEVPCFAARAVNADDRMVYKCIWLDTPPEGMPEYWYEDPDNYIDWGKCDDDAVKTDEYYPKEV